MKVTIVTSKYRSLHKGSDYKVVRRNKNSVVVFDDYGENLKINKEDFKEVENANR